MTGTSYPIENLLKNSRHEFRCGTTPVCLFFNKRKNNFLKIVGCRRRYKSASGFLIFSLLAKSRRIKFFRGMWVWALYAVQRHIDGRGADRQGGVVSTSHVAVHRQGQAGSGPPDGTSLIRILRTQNRYTVLSVSQKLTYNFSSYFMLFHDAEFWDSWFVFDFKIISVFNQYYLINFMMIKLSSWPFRFTF